MKTTPDQIPILETSGVISIHCVCVDVSGQREHTKKFTSFFITLYFSFSKSHEVSKGDLVKGVSQA